ncbi:MAG: hypothetical protein LM591_03700 [Candidatus Korarchaeum sp.]|jgi:hypothetical protein|nr:hypothetical protein [Candidatus Korarchaeum sp.]
MEVVVRVMRVLGERFVEPEDPLPENLQIAVNMNIGRVERQGNSTKCKFVIDVSYMPSIARITVEGRVITRGSPDEIEKLLSDVKEGKLPAPIVQSVYTVGTSEVIIVCRSIGVPPPLPPIPQPKSEEGIGYSL